MQNLTHNQKALLLFGVVLFAVGMWILLRPSTPEPVVEEPAPEPEVIAEVATTSQSIIGTSVEGREIEAFTFGTGDVDILFVGGVHGGYESNTVRLAEAVIDDFQTNQMIVPENITVHIIPNLNPDGYALPASASDADRRFNANGVDLNRNFDCRWAPESTWRGNVVSAGSAPFSEPEAIALRDYVTQIMPVVAAFWHSTGNAVFTSECGEGVIPATETFMNTYALAANYNAAGLFDLYPITGDAEGWLASIGIPAVTVELETRESIEWERNKAGIEAVLNLYAE